MLHPEAKKLWGEIRNAKCKECPLHKEAQTVCLIGDGPVPSEVMIVGEAPGYREDEVHKPFAGRAGQYLDTELARVGLSRSEVFISNSVKCRPPENRTPTKTEQKACRHYLDSELEAVQPSYVLLLGNTALNVIKKSGIMKHRGELYELNGATVLPTVHPAAVLRQPYLERIFQADMNTFARLVRGDPATTPPPKTYTIRTVDGLRTVVKAIFKANAVAYDIETAGRDEFDPEAAIATIAISPNPGVAFVVPISHPEAPWKRPDRVLGILGRALAYTHAKRVAHNCKFDDRWLMKFTRLPLQADFDTMIAAHLIDENRLKGLKPLAQMSLGVDPWKNVDLSAGQSLTTALSKLGKYNAKDADFTLRLYYLLRSELVKPENARLLRIFVSLLMPATRTLAQVEQYGMWIDKERLIERTIETEAKIKALFKKLTKVAGRLINWNSTQQISKVLFTDLGLPIIETTKGGAPSTRESVLLRLRHHHPICNMILEGRSLNKNMGTYLKNYSAAVDANSRLHTNYKVTGTVTGRLSSGKMDDRPKAPGLNLQQVPRDTFIRGIFGAPPGWTFVEADFSQIELRIAAHLAQEKTMLRMFRDGRDIHMEMAVKITKKPTSSITKEERKKAKSVNFGYLFGMWWRKYIEYARDNYDLEVSEEEAQESRETFFSTFPGLKAWHERQRRLVHAYKRVQSPIGRVRHLPDIDSQDKDIRGEAERQAINSPVQGLASDMMLLSLVLLHQKMNPKEAVIVGTVHDALLFEIRDDVVEKWVKVIKHTMENLPLKKMFGITLDVPIVVDVTAGRHWGEGVPVGIAS